MYDQNALREEAQRALDQIWFIQSVEGVERTDETVALRLYIREDLFVQVFWGELTESLYFALIENERRIFGIDYEGGRWHQHPFVAPERHEFLSEGLGVKLLLTFLSRVEDLLLAEDLL